MTMWKAAAEGVGAFHTSAGAFHTSKALSSDEAIVPMREVGFQVGDGVPRQPLAVSGT
ncbi:hypothetical protein HXP44_07180 [Streptomyces sioyaensis]|uniref:hypothetical protein n=1 Tax=Streptomyces sioyaensis TaxID=67364 RepID=UPI0012AB6659|nr:hypothetical protein [Streptomyces sioyaensis]MBM4791840.1 hypothetical protein [Streptomyces sioyaensis]